MKKLVCIIIFLLYFSILTACEGVNVDHIGLKDLGIDKSIGQLNSYIDTHGGFQGDGSTYIEIGFYGENAVTTEKELEENKNWSQLPLPDILQTALYGDENRESLILTFEEEIPFLPVISKGYYFFNDRHSQSKDSSDASELLSRASYNFDIIIYDTQEHILYIFRLDT